MSLRLRISIVLAAGLTVCGPQAPEHTSATEATGTTADPPGTTAGAPTTSDTAAGLTTSSGSSSTSTTTPGPAPVCDFFEQECADGFKCMPGADIYCLDDPFACVPIVDEPRGEGERCRMFDGPCNGHDDCDLGHICAYPDENQEFGTCARICDGDLGSGWSCPDDGQECRLLGGVMHVCVRTCDPLGADCPQGMTCALLPGPEWAFGCAALDPNAGGLKHPCDGHDDCLPGFACAFGSVPGCDSPFCCVNYCQLGAPGGCDALPGTECRPYWDEFAWCVPP